MVGDKNIEICEEETRPERNKMASRAMMSLVEENKIKNKRKREEWGEAAAEGRVVWDESGATGAHAVCAVRCNDLLRCTD